MTRHTGNSGLLLGAACMAAACAAPGYNPPEGPRAAERCPVNEVWVCQDHYPSRLESATKPPMMCTCQEIHNIH